MFPGEFGTVEVEEEESSEESFDEEDQGDSGSDAVKTDAFGSGDDLLPRKGNMPARAIW